MVSIIGEVKGGKEFNGLGGEGGKCNGFSSGLI
jgi:hypothetical protein